LSGIDLLSGIDVHYTSTSKNISFEQRNYARKVDRYGVILEEPEDEYNHTMDAIRYVALFLMRQGIINTI
jgi:phage terminase large subunit